MRRQPSHRFLLAVLAFVALGSSGVATARAQDPEVRRVMPFWYTLQAGLMFPAGDEGRELRRGTLLVGSIGYELNQGFVAEGDLGLFSSPDIAKTRIVMLGLHGRLNPNIHLRELYVVGGAAFYDVSYHPRLAGVVPPPDKIRPGLSFGVGYDLVTRSRMTFGVVGMYHGIVIARSDALAYVTLGIYGSLRPALF